jgi:hypothetical protein
MYVRICIPAQPANGKRSCSLFHSCSRLNPDVSTRANWQQGSKTEDDARNAYEGAASGGCSQEPLGGGSVSVGLILERRPWGRVFVGGLVRGGAAHRAGSVRACL